MDGGKILHFEQKFSLWWKNSVLWFVTIFLENSAAGRLWSCGTPSLAWNYLESFLQCTCCLICSYICTCCQVYTRMPIAQFNICTYIPVACEIYLLLDMYACCLTYILATRNKCLMTDIYAFCLIFIPAAKFSCLLPNIFIYCLIYIPTARYIFLLPGIYT
jgi:hypothetical protein